MKLPVKKHLLKLERTKNTAKSRLGYMRLDKNEDVIGFPEVFIKRIKREINSEFIMAYPEMAPLYQKIAGWLGLKEENIYITAGSDAGIKAVFEVFVGKGDRVLLLSPTYAMFYVYTRMFRGKLIKIGYRKNLSLSAEKIIEMIKKYKPRLICIANPNSPTGTIIPPGGIRKILKAAFQMRSIVLIDEAYHPFYPISAIGNIARYPNIIITRTFSKAMGLAASRLGFVAGQRGIIKALHKTRPMYETNAFAAKFAEIVIENYGLVRKNLGEVKKAKQYLEKELEKLGVPYFKSYANFVLIDTGSVKKSAALAKALRKKKILVKAGFERKPLKSCIRVTVGNMRQMKLFMRHMRRLAF